MFILCYDTNTSMLLAEAGYPLISSAETKDTPFIFGLTGALSESLANQIKGRYLITNQLLF